MECLDLNNNNKKTVVYPACECLNVIDHWHFNIYEHNQFHAQWVKNDKKSFYNISVWFCIYAKTKAQISFAVTSKLISSFVFAAKEVQSF